MKTSPIKVILTVLMFTLIVSLAYVTVALPQTPIHYSVKTIDAVNPRDINLKRDLIALVQGTGGFNSILIPHKGRNKHPIPILCPGATVNDFTQAETLENDQTVSGSCSVNRFSFGFSRYRSGAYDLFVVPGADITEIYGRNEAGKFCGQYYTPLVFGQSGFARIHGFCFDGENYQTIDFPGEFTITALLGLNVNDLVAGAFADYDPVTNELGEWTWFLCPNLCRTRQFIPLSKSRSVFILDVNKDDQALVESDAAPMLWDDGHLFPIVLPETLPESKGQRVSFTVNGFNDSGELTGQAVWRVCPEFPCPFVIRGFIATPKGPSWR